MLLQRKIDRAMKWSNLDIYNVMDLIMMIAQKDNTTFSKKELEKVEKGDVKAMILSAMITIFPVCLGVILLICLVAYFFMVR